MRETMITVGGMRATTRMMITMRGMENMMKALDSFQNLTFHNLMLMNSWIDLIWWSMSLSIMSPLSMKK